MSLKGPELKYILYGSLNVSCGIGETLLINTALRNPQTSGVRSFFFFFQAIKLI